MNTLIYLTAKKNDNTINNDNCFECTLWKEVGILTVAISISLGAMIVAFT